MVRDSPAALARARLARTRTTHSPTPYLTSGERSLQTESTGDKYARLTQLARQESTGHKYDQHATTGHSTDSERSPRLSRDAQFGPATRAEQKYPTLATAPMQQNPGTSTGAPDWACMMVVVRVAELGRSPPLWPAQREKWRVLETPRAIFIRNCGTHLPGPTFGYALFAVNNNDMIKSARRCVQSKCVLESPLLICLKKICALLNFM